MHHHRARSRFPCALVQVTAALGEGLPAPGAGEGRGGASAERTRPPLSLPSVTSWAGVGAGVWYEGCCSVVQRLGFTKRKVSVGQWACWGGGFVAEVPAPCCAPSPCVVPWCRSHLLSVAARAGRTRQAMNLSP